MNKRRSVSIPFVFIAATLLAGCENSKPPGAAKPEPAHVDRHVDENDLNKVTLTERAEQRLGIRLAETQLKEVRRTCTVGGEVLLPPGQSIVVSAPIAGALSAASSGPLPVPGSRVEAGQALFLFQPLLTPERDVLTPSERVRVAQTKADLVTAQIEAERQIESAKITVDAARIVHDRAVQLLRNKAGSQRGVDEATANLKLAQEALTTATARYKFLSGIQLDEQAGELSSRRIESPVAGVLQTLDVAVGEVVAAGEALFNVIKTGRVWIRVPVYAGQWRDIDTDQMARISEFGRQVSGETRRAAYVAAPPSANANAATVDVYYELDNEDGKLHPGQRLSVCLLLKGPAKSLVVPFKAILYDIHGGAWVYENLGEHVYARRRVSVEYVDGENAVLATGPKPGSRVVTDGAAELFGTEFGVGH